MERSLHELKGSTIHAADGDIGKVEQFFFDDEHWTVRYLVVSTGTWLSGRQVLISPISVKEVDWESRKFHVNLTQDQVRNSPDIDTTRTVSRQKEMEYYRYYRWPVYWGGVGLWGNGLYPAVLPDEMLTDEQKRETIGQEERREEEEEEEEEIHLRGTDEVAGYHILARDGEIGHVEDFIFDDRSWNILALVVDTRNWLPGRKVRVARENIGTVDWYEARVEVDLTREQIKAAPEA